MTFVETPLPWLRRHRGDLSALVLVVVASVTCETQAQSIEARGKQAAADAGPTARSIWAAIGKIGPTDFKGLGIDGTTADGMGLGEAVPVFALTMQAVADVAGGKTLEDVAVNNEVVFPVMTRERNGASILSVSRFQNGWRQDQVGRPALAQALVTVRSADAERNKRSTADYFAVEVPAARKMFLGRGVGLDARLIPLENDARLKLARGEATPVRVVMQNLLSAYPPQ